MPCYHPIPAYQHARRKGPILFQLPDGYTLQHPGPYTPLSVPCGQCIGCRLARSKDWAVRCVHESTLYRENCFVTLTYNNENLPENASLVPEHVTRFLKRWRKLIAPIKLRYFYCGEYGTLNSRPHYHLCVFNFDFPDKRVHDIRSGIPLYRSDTLETLWPYGFSTIGGVTFESAAYVARYILKKVTGSGAAAHYKDRHPEYVRMSRRPGIAHDWLTRYIGDVYPKDYVTIRNGIKARPPRYYDNIYDVIDSDSMATIKKRRMAIASDNSIDPERLEYMEEFKDYQLSEKLPRKL